MTSAPLGLAPGSTLSVYLTGTATLASLFSDAAGSTPIANPMTIGSSAYYQYYVDQGNGDVDEQISGTGIASPYTLTGVLNLDPSIGTNTTAIAAVAANLATEATSRAAADLALQKVGMSVPLGGSLVNGQQSASRVDALDPIDVVLNGTVLSGYTATVRVRVKTDNAGTSVTAKLRNVTDSTDAGTSTASVSTSGEDLSFTATLAAGAKTYRLQLLASNATHFTYATGYMQIAVP